jgi:rhamnosyltransferase subunit B
VKVVITTIGSLGDVHPCLALGLELKRRGHEVVIATSEFYRPKVMSTGLGFHSIGPKHLSPEDPELLNSIMDLKNGPENFIRKLLMPHMRRVYDDLLAVCRDAQFMITGELVFAAPLVAERLGLRWASCVLSPWQFLSAHDPSVIGLLPIFALIRGAGVTVNRAMKDFGRRQTRSWGEPIYALRQELGLSPGQHPLFEDKCSPYLNLAMFSSEFAKPQIDWPSHTKTTGFTFYDRQNPASGLTDEVRHFLRDGEPPIVFTLGSTAVINPGSFYAEGKKAAEQLGRRALLLTGKGNSGVSGTRDQMVTAYAPYSEVFPYAAAVVHQGGIGTTAQAMRAGCPQIIVPHAFDQPDHAARITRLGLGLALSKSRFDATRATTQLQRLFSDTKIRARTAQIRTLIGHENGATAAADAVENVCR